MVIMKNLGFIPWNVLVGSRENQIGCVWNGSGELETIAKRTVREKLWKTSRDLKYMAGPGPGWCGSVA